MRSAVRLGNHALLLFALAPSVACSDETAGDPSSPVADSGADTGPVADSGGDAGPCEPSGVSKRPWVLRVDETSARLRWEACREGANLTVSVSPEAGGAAVEFDAQVTPFVVNNTYTAAFVPDLAPDLAGTYFMHEASLEGLSPGTCYRYELGTEAALGGRFCTARPSGANFQFLAIADTNPGLGDSTEQLLAKVDGEAWDFAVHGGDIQYYASGLDTWASWFTSMTPMLAHGAFLPSIGNHEAEKDDEYEQYYVRFFGGAGFDGTSAYYRFQSGGVWFFAVNTEEPIEAGSAQHAWLDEQLRDAASQPGYRFSVAFFHKPFVTCGDKSQNGSARSLLEPLFAEHGMRLVIQAHMHGYERFEIPVAGPTPTTITYLTAGGGGGALGNVDENLDRATCAMRKASGAFFHVVLLDVNASGVEGRVIDQDGALKDSFSVAQ
jgi:acid phosphatase type 7